MKFQPEHFQRWQPCPPSFLEPLLHYLANRFGLPLSYLQQFLWLQQNLKTIAITNRGHQPPQKPEPMAIGIPALKISGKIPKLTTAAARFFGQQATKHVVDLASREHLNAYLSVSRFLLTAEECHNCVESGTVIVRFQSIPIGTGFLTLEHLSTPILQSQFTK